MGKLGPFWNRYVALWMAIVTVAGVVIILDSARDYSVVPVLAIAIMMVGTTSQMIRNKAIFFVPWPLRSFKSFNYTIFERWCAGTGIALFLSWLIVDVFLKYGK